MTKFTSRLHFEGDMQVWQDAAETVPVSVNGDPVKGWSDQSINGNDATNAATGLTWATGAVNGNPGVEASLAGVLNLKNSVLLANGFTVYAAGLFDLSVLGNLIGPLGGSVGNDAFVDVETALQAGTLHLPANIGTDATAFTYRFVDTLQPAAPRLMRWRISAAGAYFVATGLASEVMLAAGPISPINLAATFQQVMNEVTGIYCSIVLCDGDQAGTPNDTHVRNFERQKYNVAILGN